MFGLLFHLLFILQAPGLPNPTPADVLTSAINAVGESQTAAYIVKRDYTDSTGGEHKGSTSVIVTKSPFRFRAEHHQDGEHFPEAAVSDGKTTQSFTDGKFDQGATFGSTGSDAMVVPNDAAFDVAATWHLLLDRDYLLKAQASGRVLYLWQDDVEDDHCNVILYARDGWTDYLWISAKTGLPRATQRLSLKHGRAILGPRYEIADIRLNAPIPAGSFDFQGTDSEPPVHAPGSVTEGPASKGKTPNAGAELLGSALPHLEVRDRQYKSTLLSDVKGKPILITFWAPWCAPCVEELSKLDHLRNQLGDRLQIVAIAVQDRRTNALEFIRSHPQYDFLFFTDPDMEDETSRLCSYFRIEGIPVNVLYNSQGQMVDYWFGFHSEEDVRQKLAKIVPRTGP